MRIACKRCGEEFTGRANRLFCSPFCKSRGRSKETEKRGHLLRKYGITLDRWRQMLEAQEGICAIRGCPREAVATDHDHVTGNVRAILCHHHNMILHGHFSADDFRAMADYLESFGHDEN